MEIPLARAAPMEPLYVARFAILEPNTDRFLVTLRADSGLAEFPGGKCEPGETLVEGAARETREEVGLYAVPISPFVCYEARQMVGRPGREEYAGRQYKAHVALARVVGISRDRHWDFEEVAGEMYSTLSEIDEMCKSEKARGDMERTLPVVRRLVGAYLLSSASR